MKFQSSDDTQFLEYDEAMKLIKASTNKGNVKKGPKNAK